ncbi:NYN domain-containing protein [Variovorax ureilyticus]|uniref:NYN domain-containing protein n=1 Tax=Variovorax ureilyticus TaxID=1836198 RepID=A0ABU8VB34_9BURK
MKAGGEAKVAIYWDFENLHAVLTDQQNGQDYYRDHRMSVQAPVVDVDPVLDYAASFGDVIIHRAYGNWQFFSRYRDALNGAGIDLIQMFPRGANMKNSADIRMALDALSDIHAHPHLTHIVVVSSDSDFISLAQKAKQAGRFVAGVGVENNSNRFWIAACNEFKFYRALVELNEASELAASAAAAPAVTATSAGPSPESEAMPVEPQLPTLLSVDEARETLTKSLTQLVARQGENYVHRGTLKSLMKRLMPAFDERALGCGSFTSFLEKFPDIVRIVDAEGGGHVALVDAAPAEPDSGAG